MTASRGEVHQDFGGTFNGPVLGKGTQHNHYSVHVDSPDHLAQGLDALGARDHAAAAESFKRHLIRQPDDALTHYRLGLSLLSGKHPCLHDMRTLERAVGHLQEALRLDSALHCARAALLLIRDAALYRWGRQRKTLSNQESRILRRVSNAHALELTLHVPAPESLLWAALHERVGTQDQVDGRRSVAHQNKTGPSKESASRKAAGHMQKVQKSPRRRGRRTP